MARVINGNIQGALGDIIFYVMDGKQYARLKPQQKSRSKQPKKPAVVLFSLAGKYGTAIVKQLKAHLHITTNLTVYNHFRSWCIRLLKHQLTQEGEHLSKQPVYHSFNTSADLRDQMQLDYQWRIDDAGVVIEIPSFQPNICFHGPKKASACIVSFAVINSSFQENFTPVSCSSSSVTIPINTMATVLQRIHLPISNRQKGWLFLAISLRYVVKGKQADILETDVAYLPAAIVDGIFV